jgi:pilus assembly protein Flp/PilA
MHKLLTKMFRNQSGVTSVEYALIAALIAVAAVTILTTTGANLSQPEQDLQCSRQQALTHVRLLG